MLLSNCYISKALKQNQGMLTNHMHTNNDTMRFFAP